MIEFVLFFWVTLWTRWRVRASDEKRGEGDDCTREWSDWSKLTVTTLARSLGKNFLSIGADQSRSIRILGDLEEFSMESQCSKRFRPRFRVTRTPLPSLYFVSLQQSFQTVSFVFLEYTIPIPEWNANDPKIYIEIWEIAT